MFPVYMYKFTERLLESLPLDGDQWGAGEPRPCEDCNCVIIEASTRGHSVWRATDCKDRFKFVCLMSNATDSFKFGKYCSGTDHFNGQ